MYTQSITRAHRTAFVLLIDASGSMAETIRFRNTYCSKAEVVASLTNELLFELIERARRTEGIRDYYDVALIGYSDDDRVYSLPDGGEPRFRSICELADLPKSINRTLYEVRQPDGSIALRTFDTPQWVEPQAAGQTPMIEALRVARDLISKWCAEPTHGHSFPPIVFNITDGEATDGDEEELRHVAEQIRSLGTTDGKALLLNIHITSAEGERTLCFPGVEELLPEQRYARLLYDCSSEMPDCFNEAILAMKRTMTLPPFRGMSFNASPTELMAMLNIGSISVKTE